MGQRQQGQNLETAGGEVEINGNLGTLFSDLNLAVPPSIKLCRTNGQQIPNKSRLEMIKNLLIILQGHLDRDKPTNAEFETCSEKIVHLVPELKDPIPRIRRDAFKPWVGCSLSTALVLFDRLQK